MLLVLISWCYILFTTLTLGFAFDKITKLKSTNFVVLIFLGLFTTTLLTSFWSFFGRINIEFHLFLLAINAIICFKYKSGLLSLCQTFFSEIAPLSKALKLFLALLAILILAQSAAAPYFFDNETYYIQTIKWLNEYGFVKGLANLHIFLAQTSGWHIAQSAFSFSFLYPNFNDLNGFSVLLINLFAVLKLNAYNRTKSQEALLIGILPLANLFFFQFISAPSPDLAVYVLSCLLFYYFLKHFYNITSEVFNLIVILALFIIYIKITALPIILLPIALLLINYKKLILKITQSTIVSILVLVLFIAKNVIISGYPLFPSTCFKDTIAQSYALPIEINQFWFNTAKMYDIVVNRSEFHYLSYFEIFIKWLFYSKMDSVFNCTILLLVLIIPLFLYRFLNTKAYWVLYFTMLFQLVFLFLSSPQYRFILQFVLIFGFLLIAHFIKKVHSFVFLYYVSLIPIVITLISPIQTSAILQYADKSFNFENFIFPSKNSNINTTYHKAKIENLSYFSPDSKTYIWVTGNGNLPCVNEVQLKYFEQGFFYIPQQRSTDLNDGFYSQKISGHE
jgi:hypothetical protein